MSLSDNNKYNNTNLTETDLYAVNTYYSAAKINLFLQVEGKRADGYHLLNSVMQSVSLFDRIDIGFGCPEFSLDTMGLDLGNPEKNTITRMWRLLKERYGLPGEIAVRLNKKIPVGAGLAGGSGNAAAVLRAVNDYYALNLSYEEIINCSASIGADVAFCYFGGTCLARGIGEKLTVLPSMPDWHILLFNGGFHISTPEIYRLYDDIALGMEDIPIDMMLHALEQKSKEGILYSLYNALEKVTFPRYQSLRSLSDRLDDLFLPHLMSGSGPTVFALAEAVPAENVMKQADSFPGTVYSVRPINGGIFSKEELKSLILSGVSVAL